MHHRALYLLTSRAAVVSTHTQTNSFTSLLQVAAARAWSRRVSTNAPTTSGETILKKPHKSVVKRQKNNEPKQHSVLSGDRNPVISSHTHNKSRSNPPHAFNTQKANSVRSQRSTHAGPSSYVQESHSKRKNIPVGLAYIEPELLSEADIDYVEEGSSISDIVGTRNPVWDASDCVHGNATPISRPVNHLKRYPEQQRYRVLRPKTSGAFYQNLLRLISKLKHPPGLPAILDYHGLYPERHTTRSYNLLLGLTLRHTAFGTFQSLLNAMRSSHIERNLETWKLEVRWLVQTESWDHAWKQISDQRNRQFHNSEGSEIELPLPIWLEFFRTANWDAHQRQNAGSRLNNQGNGVPGVSANDHMNQYRDRRRLLFQCMPSDMENLNQTAPDVIRTIISSFLKTQQQEDALFLTTSYLRALPRRLTARRRHGCIDIINLHVAKGSSSKGLRKLYESRRTLFSLLRLHRGCRPNSTTLFLLLSPLHRAKRCGTIAKNIAQAFRAAWGDQTEDQKVRRRVVTLALKEGRMDIAQEYLESEKIKSAAREAWSMQQDVLGNSERSPYRKLLRSPGRRLFAKNGREGYLWCLARHRARQVGLKRRRK